VTTDGESSPPTRAAAAAQPAETAAHGQRTDGVLALTPSGARTAGQVFAAKHDWLEHQLSGWSPAQHAELENMLTKLSREMLGDAADRRLADR
jgi:hypothetical protein